MFDTKPIKSSNEGISPVIGVILMVAITVTLGAVIGVFVVDLGQGVSEPPTGAVSTTQDYNGDGTYTLNTKVTTLQSAEEIVILDESDTVIGTANTVGGTITIPNARGEETYTVLARNSDKESVVRTEEIECTSVCADIIVDTNNGPETDHATLSNAFYNAESGDTVFVRDGRYNGNFYINREGLTVVGQSESNVIIQGSTSSNGNSLLFIDSPNTTVQNMTLETDGDDGLFFSQNATGGQASDLTISKITGYSAIFVNSTDTTLNNIDIQNVGQNGFVVNSTAQRTKIQNSTVDTTENAGVVIQGSQTTVTNVQTTNIGSSAVNINTNSVTIENSQLQNSTDYGVYMNTEASDVTVTKTKIVDNGEYAFFVENSADTIQLTQSSIYGNTYSIYNNDGTNTLNATSNYWGDTGVNSDCTPVSNRVDGPGTIDVSSPLCEAP